MENHLVDFEKINWEYPDTGIRYKKYMRDGQILRLLEFSEGFIEKDYCVKGHSAYVLEGSFALDFNGKVEKYKTGDIIFISKGEADKHKALIGQGEKVTLLLFEIE
jgi:hypothetical protein